MGILVISGGDGILGCPPGKPNPNPGLDGLGNVGIPPGKFGIPKLGIPGIPKLGIPGIPKLGIPGIPGIVGAKRRRLVPPAKALLSGPGNERAARTNTARNFKGDIFSS
ncbi:collagen alpha-2(IV) chain [Striga asiatica]|uniref:Collagen alpha-2(IV) chain n=1 Tax=Striga asiatica TaxID=4170 RepID=A0A5A7PDQ1_STRAF|nr:collagen alpha-2(IV) chain [Striga asiatica]